MKISILTLFPEMFQGPFEHSILKRAQEKELVEIECINIRDFGIGSHKMVDDTPYGGGVGMVLKVDVLHKAIEYAKANYHRVILSASEESQSNGDPSAKHQDDKIKTWVILTSASGEVFKQQMAKQFSQLDHLIIICGHYEGVDDRIRNYIDEEVSIGDFVLTGGELPAMLIADSIIRLIDGVITQGATEDESFSEKNRTLLEYPHYTKPRTYEGHEVPEILRSGNHKAIDEWRAEKSLEKTKRVRPDLLKE
ncbi:MAG: tRNA (guanosine(37)-N1)-methyltransferase TrmD [Candidatus Levyibacteriota bacterium]